ncbi:50S ribosomal protein L15 [Candidatus Uhrbacteria bacterium CG10_big_fil_rev_8_21_14_0_10_48_16]|uniref:Large ribosomal subunit protein uL15 n=1 Tax=Candidatus Uhrbacteria bacterium CG10_big_fil_rev_8_21_14_0_10_48_16 TaxID=1975038 RepID=A0A2M8LGP1_9BACT|nr:MAG: 50S ribosomal protein L15 [Candidatus Uhrbacteria bacterium CG10_big_fil_rev_8_21_14_0_10_48_16]
MPLTLHSIQPQKGSQKSKKRIGRGLGSTGRYSGRGIKGQKARSGVTGLQKLGIRQIMLATPKNRGFKSSRPKAQSVNVDQLSREFKSGAKVSPAILLKKGLIESTSLPVKVLAKGAITISITLTDCAVSDAAKKKIEEAGGTVVAR